MTTTIHTSRRRFLQSATVATGGLVIGFYLPGANKFAEAQSATGQAPLQPNAFLKIGKDGVVTVTVKHLEFGQGVMTALPMLVAEELECDWSKVKAQLAPAAPVYVHTMYGIQATGGSSSVLNSWQQMRQVGAAARMMLVQAAAQRWKVDAARCRAENGLVLGPAGQKASYGDLAEAASKLPVPEKLLLKDIKSFHLIGKSMRRVEAKDKVDGSAKFGFDVTPKMLPGLHTAVVAHPPLFGARVKSFDADKLRGLPGITHVVQISNGVAVVGKTFWAVKQGRDLLKIEWDFDAAAKVSTPELRQAYQDMAKTPGQVVKKEGDPEAIKTAAKTLSAEYEFPFLAHAPMEPLNCTVYLTGETCELWVGSQTQTVDQGAAAKVAGLKPEQVKLNTMLAGGGFGRRGNPASDYVIEAVEIAKEVKVPVKLLWTREDDIKGGYYRPMYLHRVNVGLDTAGRIAGWDHVIVGQSILAGTAFESAMVKGGIDRTSVEGVSNSPYAIPNFQVSLHTTKTGVPGLWWRSVGHTHTAFVMETMIDEAAKAAGKDPLVYRRELLAKYPRMLKTLELAAEKAGWGSPLPKDRARGIAVHESFGSVCAQVVEVSLEKQQIKVHRVVAAINCGLVVNPLGVQAQVESAICYGLSAALGGAITLKDGVVEQSNFHDYPVVRIDAMPKIEVHIVEGGTSPTGVGEPGTPPIAPALANALFALTGKRLRNLPFNLNELKNS